MGGLALDEFGTRSRMVVGRGPPGAFQPVRHELDGIVALGMDHHQGAFLLGDVEHFEQLPVVQHHVVIGHEDL